MSNSSTHIDNHPIYCAKSQAQNSLPTPTPKKSNEASPFAIEISAKSANSTCRSVTLSKLQMAPCGKLNAIYIVTAKMSYTTKFATSVSRFRVLEKQTICEIEQTITSAAAGMELDQTCSTSMFMLVQI